MVAPARPTAPRHSREPEPAPTNAPGPLILVERRGPVGILTLNNPPVNVLSAPLLEELAKRVVELADDPSVRVLVIASAMKLFSGGANIRAMVAMDRAEASAFSAKGQAVANLLERVPLPIIAAVHGFCFGGGSEMCQACDFIVASEDAVFCQPEISIGVLPGWGGSRRLPRKVGDSRARRWIMTGERVSAQTAFEYGLVDQVVPREKLLDQAVAFASELATKPALALAACKYAVNQSADPGRLLGLQFERELWRLLFETGDQKEGMRAFLEKRPAAFTDRRDHPGRPPEFPWELPGNPFEAAREGAHPTGKDAASGGKSVPGPLDPEAIAEAYRDTAMRAFQAYVEITRNATESYRYWAEVALKDLRELRPKPPRSPGEPSTRS